MIFNQNHTVWVPEWTGRNKCRNKWQRTHLHTTRYIRKNNHWTEAAGLSCFHKDMVDNRNQITAMCEKYTPVHLNSYSQLNLWGTNWASDQLRVSLRSTSLSVSVKYMHYIDRYTHLSIHWMSTLRHLHLLGEPVISKRM